MRYVIVSNWTDYLLQ